MQTETRTENKLNSERPAQPSLTAAARSALRARAHKLAPVVMISTKGLTDAVLAEIDRSLTSHELIKIRVLDTDRVEREALRAQICARSGAAPVQHIGKVLVVYRQNAEPADEDADPRTPKTRKTAASTRDRITKSPTKRAAAPAVNRRRRVDSSS